VAMTETIKLYGGPLGEEEVDCREGMKWMVVNRMADLPLVIDFWYRPRTERHIYRVEGGVGRWEGIRR